MKLFITGGTGFVGTTLSETLLNKGHKVIATGTSSSHKLTGRKHFEFISADTTQQGPWQESLKDIDGVINLAGKNIFRLWSDEYKNQIYNSRILTTRHLVDALPENKDIILLSTSAAGYYGDQGDEILDEKASSGTDFLAKVCIDWENEAIHAEKKGVRVVTMRFGVVMGKNGGALSKMVLSFRFFMGGPLGKGLQWFPWIHIEDLIGAILFILGTPNIQGPINFTAPNPMRYRDFAHTLGNVINRPSFMPVPAVLIRLLMGELGKSFLNSQRVIPEKLTVSGFSFSYPELRMALSNIFP